MPRFDPLITDKLLARGAGGPAVKAVQEYLNALGYDTSGDQEGNFGGHTEAAVREFQVKFKEEHGKEFARTHSGREFGVDGIVGPQTFGALRQEIEKHNHEHARTHPHAHAFAAARTLMATAGWSVTGGQAGPTLAAAQAMRLNPSTPHAAEPRHPEPRASIAEAKAEGLDYKVHPPAPPHHPQPQHFSSSHQSVWTMYVHADPEPAANGAAQGSLVLRSPDGKEHKYQFESGPGSKGALPGLVNDNNLGGEVPNKFEPHTRYAVGPKQGADGDYHFETTDRKTGFFIPLENGAVIARNGFGIHPNRKGADGEQVGTAGCIGLADKDAKAFIAQYNRLVQEGLAPRTLDVYAHDQNPEQILAHQRILTEARHIVAHHAVKGLQESVAVDHQSPGFGGHAGSSKKL